MAVSAFLLFCHREHGKDRYVFARTGLFSVPALRNALPRRSDLVYSVFCKNFRLRKIIAPLK